MSADNPTRDPPRPVIVNGSWAFPGNQGDVRAVIPLHLRHPLAVPVTKQTSTMSADPTAATNSPTDKMCELQVQLQNLSTDATINDTIHQQLNKSLTTYFHMTEDFARQIQQLTDQNSALAQENFILRAQRENMAMQLNSTLSSINGMKSANEPLMPLHSLKTGNPIQGFPNTILDIYQMDASAIDHILKAMGYERLLNDSLQDKWLNLRIISAMLPFPDDYDGDPFYSIAEKFRR